MEGNVRSTNVWGKRKIDRSFKVRPVRLHFGHVRALVPCEETRQNETFGCTKACKDRNAWWGGHCTTVQGEFLVECRREILSNKKGCGRGLDMVDPPPTTYSQFRDSRLALVVSDLQSRTGSGCVHLLNRRRDISIPIYKHNYAMACFSILFGSWS